MNRSIGLLACMTWLLACGHGDGALDAGDARATDATDVVDGGVRSDGPSCSSDTQCDDGVFCNGVERCAPRAPGADARGCVTEGRSPCQSIETCDETAGRCALGCTGPFDADGDGHRSIPCGGDDCDDHDAHRFPGNTEVCDVGTASDGTLVRLVPSHDEDCDPTTFANGVSRDGDHDRDGYIDLACCNADRNGVYQCGTDCADLGDVTGFAGTEMATRVTAADIHPAQPEVCNGVDDNCNGAPDEGVARMLFPDVDHDGFGDRAASPAPGCRLADGVAENSLDCDDTHAAISPVAVEVCDGVDNNCDHQVDEAPASAIACAARFGNPAQSLYACVDRACTVASCGSAFLDCDARLDNGCETDGRSDVQNCGACGHACGAGGVCTDGVCDAIVSVSAGAGYACALRATHRVACWGRNSEGQLGEGTGMDQSRPVMVPGIVAASAISATRFDDDWAWDTCATTCAQIGVTVECWGCSTWAQQGVGSAAVGDVYVPTLPAQGIPTYDRRLGVATTHALSVGGGYVLAAQQLDRDQVYSWGAPIGYRPLARITDPAISPTAMPWGLPGVIDHVTGLSDDTRIVAVSAGKTHACAITSTHGMYCWGQDIDGQIGNGTYTAMQLAATPPTLVALPTGASTWLDVSAANQFTCAVTDDDASSAHDAGRLFCWGVDSPAADPLGTAPLSPVAIGGVSGVVHVAAGDDHACVLLEDHTVRCLGQNARGQLGNGTTVASRAPVSVAGLTGVAQLSAGRQLTCAVTMAGEAYCWGLFGGSQPTRVPGL